MAKMWLVIGVVIFACSGCSSRGIVTLESAVSHCSSKKSVVIFVPGFKGSELRDAQTDEVIWIRSLQTISEGPTLALPLPDLELKKPGPLLEAGEILTELKVVPGVYSYDVYAETLRKLQRVVGSTTSILPFSYDWREDLVDSARQLAATIDQLHISGCTNLMLVAHSMGGLVAAYYLQYGDQPLETAERTWRGAQKVNRVIFAGVPFHGAITIFNDMQNGIRTFLNSSLLNPEALSTFPASYQLLPGPEESSLRTPNLSADVALHDVESWEKFNWGLFASKDLSSSALQSRRTYTKRQLDRSALFYQKLLEPSPPRNPKENFIPQLSLLNLVGFGSPTMTLSIVNPSSGVPIFTEQELASTFPHISPSVLLQDGDSVVPSQSATLPSVFDDAFLCQEVTVPSDHGSVISGTKSLEQIQKFLLTEH